MKVGGAAKYDENGRRVPGTGLKQIDRALYKDRSGKTKPDDRDPRIVGNVRVYEGQRLDHG